MTLQVGTDTKPYGELRTRDGKVYPVAKTAGGKQQLEQMFDLYAGMLLAQKGGESTTADDVLKFMATRMNGRTWATMIPLPSSTE